jgi:alanine dehydrogenase
MALLLQEEDVRRLLTMEHALTAVEDAFRAQARGEASNFPRQRNASPGVDMNILCAASTALDAAAIKCYPVVRQDISVGSSFTVLVYRISTGAMIGVLEANTLGQIRTGAASGVATKYLARAESRVMTLFGSGWQAESQLEAIARVLPKLERVNVVGRSAERAQRFCRTMAKRLDVELVASGEPERAVREADVITTITGSREPVFDGRWLRPGVHINAAGSNFAEKQELDSAAVQRSDLIVVDDVAVARIESGDLLAAEAKDGLDWSRVQALCHVVAGAAPRRTSPEQITLFESHGLGLEDLAVAARVLELARGEEIGIEVPIR